MTEELRQALQEQQGRPVAEEVVPSTPPRVFPMPFVQAITDTPIPTSVVPVKAVFTGVEDPEAHLTTFHTQMMLSGGIRRRVLQDVREHAPGNGVGMVCEPA